MIDATQIVQLVGSTCVVIFALMLFRIASGHWFCSYGREAIACSAAYILTGAVIRTASVFDVITRDSAIIASGFVAMGFVAIMSQIIILHRLKHRGEIG